MNRILQFLIFIFWSTLLYSKNIVIDGVTFSADGSILIKFPTDKFYKEYIIPEGESLNVVYNRVWMFLEEIIKHNEKNISQSHSSSSSN